MHTPTCRHTHTHKHLQVIVLEFMGHLIYRHTLYVWIQDVLNTKKETDCQLLRRDDDDDDNVKRNLPEDFILPRKTSSASRQLLYARSDLPSVGSWTGEGKGKRKNCHFLALSPPNPPCSFQEWHLHPTAPLSRQKSRRKQAVTRPEGI